MIYAPFVVAIAWCLMWLFWLGWTYAGYKERSRRQDACMQAMFKELENPTRIHWPDSWK